MELRRRVLRSLRCCHARPLRLQGLAGDGQVRLAERAQRRVLSRQFLVVERRQGSDPDVGVRGEDRRQALGLVEGDGGGAVLDVGVLANLDLS
jgi:hypothetical protein